MRGAKAKARPRASADGRIGESEGMEERESGNKTTFAEIF